jgi:hypothetical protein
MGSVMVARKSWSLSSLGTYEQCAAKYRYKYIDGIPEARNAAANRGVSSHALVEGYLKGDLTTLTPELSFYQGFFDQIRRLEAYPEIKLGVDHEWRPVPWEDENIWWKGVLDLLVFPKPEEAIIYDWKTGKIYPDHDEQKAIYTLGVFSTYPAVRSVRAVHVYLDLGKNREKTYHRDQMYMLREPWTNRVRRLERDTQFIPNPSYRCTRCSFSRAQGGPCRF